MKESTPEREARRHISKQLTAQINNAQAYPEVRSVVVKALSDIKDRLRSLVSTVRRDYNLRPEQALLFFYVKGGNALDALIERPAEPPPTLFDFGRSDWDTQVVINPWIPIPAQDALHGGVEDIVIEVMGPAGLNIALEISLAPPAQNPLCGQVVDLTTVDIYVPPGQSCLVTCDNPQTFRKVYERDRAGLHLFTSTPLKGIGSTKAATAPSNAPVLPAPAPQVVPPVQPAPAPPPPPGIILNDGIKPFVLYRLGYTWHARWVKDPRAPTGDDPVTPRPILMELIDVTTPRRDTVEAITVWSDIVRNHLVITEDAGADERWRLPLPSMEYHLWEGLTMLCEIAAYPNWPGADKLDKRRRNVQRIHDWYLNQQRDLSVFQRVIDGISAKQVHTAGTGCMEQVDACMTAVKDAMRDAMAGVEQGALTVRQRNQLMAGRQWGMQWMETLLQRLGAPLGTACGFSDDLALVATLAQNPYLDLNRVPVSGVDYAVVIRTDYATLCRATIASCMQALDWIDGRHVTIEDTLHSTVRPTGISYERTLVIFHAKRAPSARLAKAIITLTTADAVGCPFRDSPAGAGQVAPLLDMDNQRKVAASIIQGFVQRATLSKQHEAIRTLLPQPL